MQFTSLSLHLKISRYINLNLQNFKLEETLLSSFILLTQMLGGRYPWTRTVERDRAATKTVRSANVLSPSDYENYLAFQNYKDFVLDTAEHMLLSSGQVWL